MESGEQTRFVAQKVARVRFRLPIIWVLILVGFAIAARAGAINDLPVICPFRLATGLPCCACGITRGLAAVTRGELIAAARYHVAAIPLAILVLFAIVVKCITPLVGHARVAAFWRRWSGTFVAVIIVLLLAGWPIHLIWGGPPP